MCMTSSSSCLGKEGKPGKLTVTLNLTAYFSLKTITEYQRLHLTTFNIYQHLRERIFRNVLCVVSGTCLITVIKWDCSRHEISPDNVNRQSREEVVRSNGMISRGKLNKCSQVVPAETNERCNFERLSFADHCPVRDGKLLRMVPQARQVLSRVAKWAELLVGGMAGHCLCRGEGVTYTSR